jgi:hypothetical protein
MNNSDQDSIHFTYEDWERVQRDTCAWWAGELDRPLVWLSAAGPVASLPFGYQSNYPLDMPADQVVDGYAPVLAATRYYGDAFPWLWINFGPGIMAGFLGAKVNSVTQPLETVWFTPVEKKPIQDLTLAFDPQNPWWRRVKEITGVFVDRYGEMLQVSHTDLGGNLDILASFLETQQLLMDVVEQPDEVLRLVRQITTLWIRYYDELEALLRPACPGTSCWTPLWSPGKTYMLQCDFSYMISPRMFEKFVLPDLAGLCGHLDHGFYHLDGRGEIPHLDLLLSISRLRGIQWIPGDGAPPPEDWLPLLKRVRDGNKLCQVFVTPEGARKIVRSLGGRGFLFVIYATQEQFPDGETARAFLHTLAREDAAVH